MKITNKTRYSGVVLRALILSTVTDVEDVLRNDNERAPLRASAIRDYCRVTVVYTRNGGCSGWATLNGACLRIRIQRKAVSLVELIWLIRHEVYHLFGVEHAAMADAINNRSAGAYNNIRERFVEHIERYGDTLSEISVAAKVKPTLEKTRSEKLTSIQERIDRWESKRKRAETAIAKLTKKQRYYEWALAKAAKGPTS